MSLREELEKAIAAQWEPDAGDDAANWLIRDHGQDLLVILDENEQYKQRVRELLGQIATFHATYSADQSVDGGGDSRGWACSHCHGSGIGIDGKPCPISHPINGGGV